MYTQAEILHYIRAEKYLSSIDEKYAGEVITTGDMTLALCVGAAHTLVAALRPGLQPRLQIPTTQVPFTHPHRVPSLGLSAVVSTYPTSFTVDPRVHTERPVVVHTQLIRLAPAVCWAYGERELLALAPAHSCRRCLYTHALSSISCARKPCARISVCMTAT
ncbi:hypothetical protein CALCODRAFT_91294 [Calocera cornea HHB12733]|uniref:Uncharacterized protein n=1 Tax=Calocera cornea HHB12733 TaxID=1353952 RepID=A0A165DAQ8_9BASI|nr:hypothetical protein CALCODRAFT_91294 [Calocera cornea HHB12733]